jgi:hypothetical protein
MTYISGIRYNCTYATNLCTSSRQVQTRRVKKLDDYCYKLEFIFNMIS